MNLGYVISTIIAGMVLLSLIALNSRIMRGSGEQTLYTMAKIESDMIVDYFKDDMRIMGYRIDGSAIVDADSSRIRFRTRPNENNDDIMEIEWFFDATFASSGRNPNVRPLYRIVNNGDEISIGSGVVDFTLEYLDAERLVIANPETQLDNIRQIRLNMVVESLDSYDPNRFERSTWRGEITPFNLRPN